jgi:hypothetical protein
MARVIGPWFEATAEIEGVPGGAATHQPAAAAAGAVDKRKVRPSARRAPNSTRPTPLTGY